MKKKYKYIVGAIIIIILLPQLTKNIHMGPLIGVVEVGDVIISSKEIIDDFNYLIEEIGVDGILLRINSPGGAVAPSQEIYQKVKTVSQDLNIPVIASMGSVAASGGYYIALGADTIIANLGTTTGSIGVIMGYPIINELMSKIGVDWEVVKSGKLKDAGSFYRTASQEEKEYFQDFINGVHNQFINVVAYERQLSIDNVKEISDGRIYTGEHAFNLGLVDAIGTYEDAINLINILIDSDEKAKLIYPEDDDDIFSYLMNVKSNIIHKNMYYAKIPQYMLYYGE